MESLTVKRPRFDCLAEAETCSSPSYVALRAALIAGRRSYPASAFKTKP